MITKLKDDLAKYSLPLRPKTFGADYQFPEDSDKLASADLGTWMFKLAAWKGYALRMLADVEIEKSWLKNQHDNKISQKIALDSGKYKVTKDFALGSLILNDESFKKIRTNLTIKETELNGLRQVIDIYTMQIEVVSREISRRSLDLKLMQRGIPNDGE